MDSGINACLVRVDRVAFRMLAAELLKTTPCCKSQVPNNAIYTYNQYCKTQTKPADPTNELVNGPSDRSEPPNGPDLHKNQYLI